VKTLVVSVIYAACLASPALAGGPVVVVEEPKPEVSEEAPTSKRWLPLLVVPLFICVVMCGQEEE
jgi:hypothetical protein